ncbi:hypothetical protein, partial [Streptomyces sp900116325]|uniref:hypothetical protein n=1 Tax=Streptomyces sp. 900116325 TaxID=3154295 RepID=UPI0033A0133C
AGTEVPAGRRAPANRRYHNQNLTKHYWSAHHGERVGGRDERLDDMGAAAGAGRALLATTVVPGVGVLDSLAGAGSAPFRRGVPSSLAT